MRHKLSFDSIDNRSLTSDTRSEASVSSSIRDGELSAKASRRLLWKQNKWASKYDCLLIMATSCMSIRDGVGMMIKDSQSSEPSLIHYFIIYMVVMIPMGYTQIFIGQYSQLGISLFRYMTPLGHGLMYCYLLHSIIDCIIDGISLAYYILYTLSCLSLRMEWMICPEGSTRCWGINNCHLCESNCVTAHTKLSATLYWREVFLQRPMSFKGDFNLDVPLLPQTVSVIMCWSVVYVISSMGFVRYIKIIRVVGFFLGIMTVLLLMVVMFTKGALVGLAQIFNVPEGSLLDLVAWSRAIFRACSMGTLGQVYIAMYGSYMTADMNAETLTPVAIMLNFVITVAISALMNATSGILIERAHLQFSDANVIWRHATLPQFSIIPEALGFLGVPILWTAIYFLIGALFTLISLVSRIDVIEKSMSEAHHQIENYRTYTLAGISLFSCAIGILLSSPASQLLIRELTFNVQPATNTLELFVFSILIYWVYKVQRLSDDIHFLTGEQPAKYFKICWYLLPVVMGVPFVYYNVICISERFRCSAVIHYGLIVLLIHPLLILLIINIFKYLKIHNLISIVQPEERWGPPDPRERHLRRMFNPREETRLRRRNDACKHKCLLNSKILEKAVDVEGMAEEEDAKVVVQSSSLSLLDDE